MSDGSFITALRAMLVADTRLQSNLVLYTPFGIVRGRVTRQFIEQQPVSEALELDECEVEHFSSHMPTGHFAKFYVRLTDIQGFSLR